MRRLFDLMRMEPCHRRAHPRRMSNSRRAAGQLTSPHSMTRTSSWQPRADLFRIGSPESQGLLEGVDARTCARTRRSRTPKIPPFETVDQPAELLQLFLREMIVGALETSLGYLRLELGGRAD